MELRSPVYPGEQMDDQFLCDLDLLSTQELARRCIYEISRFRAQQTSDGRYGRALFRRAITEHDDEAWFCIYQQFMPLVLTWMSQHPQTHYVLEYDSYDSLVNAAFAKFFQAMTPTKFDTFPSLASLLKYLRRCADSVIMDALRSQQVHQGVEDALDKIEAEPAADDPAECVMRQLAARDMWQVIYHVLQDEKERVFFTLMCMCDMKPAEIHRWQHHLFPTVKEVYRIKHNVFQRLRRNRSLRVMWMDFR